MDNFLIWLIVLPLGIGILNTFLPLLLRKILTLAGLVGGMLLIIPLYDTAPQTLEAFGYLLLKMDALALFTLLFIQLISLLIFIFALKGVSAAVEKQFMILFPLTVAVCNATVLSDHMILFLIMWGLAGLALYLFALLGRSSETPQMAKKTFILVGGSDAFLIMSLAMMWVLQPAADWSLAATSITLEGGYAITAFIFLLIAAFTKAGGFPFHTWVPDFSKEAPVESAAFLPASLDKLLGIYLLARVMISLFSVTVTAQMIVITLGALTVITAVMMAMNQHNGRRLLGYHAVSQVGYMIMGVASLNPLAFAGGLFHMVNHIIYKTNLFLSLGAVEKKTGSNDLDELGGMARFMPLTFIAALVGALSISGIPPFNGFFSKWMIYQGLLEKTAGMSGGFQVWLLVCIILALFGSALTLASFLKFLHAIFLGRVRAKFKTIGEAPFNQLLALGGLSLLCIVFGIFAVQIPINLFLENVLNSYNWTAVGFIGLYDPSMVTLMLLLAFGLGIAVYYIVRKVRFDDIYIGGKEAEEQFRVSGTAFYNEVRRMVPLKTIFDAADKRKFDVYDLGGNSTFALSRVFRRAHPGQLQLYLLYIVLGVLIFIWLI